MTPRAPVYILVGFFGLHLFNRFITAFICEKSPDGQYGLGLVPMLGIGFHSFADGIVYSITFTVSVFTGTLAAIGMVFQEIPEGIITYLLLVRSGFSERKSLVLAALTTPLGDFRLPPLHQSHRQAVPRGASCPVGRGADLCGCDAPIIPNPQTSTGHTSGGGISGAFC